MFLDFNSGQIMGRHSMKNVYAGLNPIDCGRSLCDENTLICPPQPEGPCACQTDPTGIPDDPYLYSCVEDVE